MHERVSAVLLRSPFELRIKKLWNFTFETSSSPNDSSLFWKVIEKVHHHRRRCEPDGPNPCSNDVWMEDLIMSKMKPFGRWKVEKSHLLSPASRIRSRLPIISMFCATFHSIFLHRQNWTVKVESLRCKLFGFFNFMTKLWVLQAVQILLRMSLKTSVKQQNQQRKTARYLSVILPWLEHIKTLWKGKERENSTGVNFLNNNVVKLWIWVRQQKRMKEENDQTID